MQITMAGTQETEVCGAINVFQISKNKQNVTFTEQKLGTCHKQLCISWIQF